MAKNQHYILSFIFYCYWSRHVPNHAYNHLLQKMIFVHVEQLFLGIFLLHNAAVGCTSEYVSAPNLLHYHKSHCVSVI